MFQEPPMVLAGLFPEYMTLGAVSTRPGTAIILGLTAIPKVAYEKLSACKVRSSQESKLGEPTRF